MDVFKLRSHSCGQREAESSSSSPSSSIKVSGAVSGVPRASCCRPFPGCSVLVHGLRNVHMTASGHCSRGSGMVRGSLWQYQKQCVVFQLFCLYLQREGEEQCLSKNTDKGNEGRSDCNRRGKTAQSPVWESSPPFLDPSQDILAYHHSQSSCPPLSTDSWLLTVANLDFNECSQSIRLGSFPPLAFI